VESGDNETIVDNDEFINKVNSAKDSLLADNEAEIPDSSPVYDGVISVSNLKEAIPSFDTNNTDAVQIYENE
jgi:hypothetical protein